MPTPLLAGHEALGCQLIHKGGQLVNTATGERLGVSTDEIGLRGYFPLVVAGMTAIIADIRYRILSAGSDSQKVKTRLIVEQVR